MTIDRKRWTHWRATQLYAVRRAWGHKTPEQDVPPGEMFHTTADGLDRSVIGANVSEALSFG